jgi:hypothetical protein
LVFCQAEGEHESKPFKKFKPKAPEVPKVFTKDERRQIKKERRARKPHGEVPFSTLYLISFHLNVLIRVFCFSSQALEAANELWKVSLSKISTDQQTTEISSVLANIKDKLVEVSQAHDASRVVENCVKYGTVEQREQIHQALTSAFSYFLGLSCYASIHIF